MVKIVGLLENTSQSQNLKRKHGLSLYIETEKHKILFDTGPNGLFLKNAEKLGVNIANIDIAVISHGHVDHLGGLKYFLKTNQKAKCYIRPQALEKHYVKMLGIPFYAGIDRMLIKEDRFIFTEDRLAVDDEITLFSNVSGDFPLPESDNNLFVEKNGKIVKDDFYHEQNLIIKSGEKRILICGCAHSGIVNIVRKAKTVLGEYPSAVIGGFHLYEPVKRRYESGEYIDRVAAVLNESNTVFYTCHCTGVKAYEKMKERLGNGLNYLHTGSQILL